MKQLLISGIIALTLLPACTEKPAEAEKKSDTADTCKTKPLNPNGDSELAILMREMTAWTENTQQFIGQHTEMPANFPENFKTLTTAKATDSTLDRVTFNVYANSWLMAYEKFKRSDATDRAQNFNNIVNACAGCHGQFCQGPLKRINKMRVEEK
ncbi:MAG: hypothetical protein FD123_2792 [Bacteroidetes bacterium]|nr:MAG: hypothetical protein FD123_2792 [Bacteroidota bacterium]